MPDKKQNEWRQALRGEPGLEEVLSDPIIERLMTRDGVNPDEVRQLAKSR